MERSDLESVVQATAMRGGATYREVFEREARRHRDPEHVRRLDERRAELATLPSAELVRRAASHHLRMPPDALRFALVEAIATHEVAHELQVERYMQGEEMMPLEGDVDGSDR